MAIYAIGDVQGCYDSLCALLERIGFDEGADRAWFAGDLVNRGPSSLAVLRFVRSLGDRATTVLGNHDLHLLARAAGLSRPRQGDTLQPVFDAPDADELLSWLRFRPLLHESGGEAMVHAGLHPAWTLAEARRLAREVETALRGEGAADVLDADDGPAQVWRADLAGGERLRSIVTIMTRIRMCAADGALVPTFSGPPESAPTGTYPWFAHPERRRRGVTMVFGHWAALGFRRGDDYLALDSGCVWGGSLTAVRLDDGAVFQQPCAPGDQRSRR